MVRKKECIAMLLAGGQGSRLGVLTQNVAKPAVPFGARYRIIDFTLSNCINSSIDTVGVLTQYMPLELNEYIGNGQPWGLDRNGGGVHTLQPYAKSKTAEWYKGTANAIYQNIEFIDRYQPEYVAVLSGDHIYKMDYSEMLAFHKKNQSDCTIAVIDVDLKDASRFGIMNTNPDGSVYEFEEKPKNPKSTKASMGVYIFTWKVLREFLIKDEEDENSENDFGKNIIPSIINAGHNVFAYSFEGYWKDVGTIESLWEANMDLINPNVPMDLNDKNFRIYARDYDCPPTFIADNSKLYNSFITKGCDISGEVSSSVIFSDCIIKEGAIINDSVIFPGAVIEEGAEINFAIVGSNVVVGKNAKIGGRPENYEGKNKWGIAVIGDGNSLAPDSIVIPKEMV